MLSAQNLRKEYSNVVAVDDVSFTVKRGQIFGLIGPNGAGKSTTIRMILNIIQPDRGSIMINGEATNHASRNIIGYLPEERGLYKKYRLINVIAYFAALRGMERKDALRAAEYWLDRFNLSEYAKRDIEELSKGNQQKVQFIISVAHKPELIVLDELFAGLDPVNQMLMKDALLELKRSNRAIIFSTHQMDKAEQLSDDLMLINKGKTVFEGTPVSIKQRYGKNSVRLEFTGDALFMKNLKGVTRSDISLNYAEVELGENASTTEFLAAVLPRLEISSFSRIEPSLQSIFIDTVGLPEDGEQTPEQHTVAIKPKLALKDTRVRKALVSVIVLLLGIVGCGVSLLKHPESLTLIITIALAIGFILSIVRFQKVRRIVAEENRAILQSERRSRL